MTTIDKLMPPFAPVKCKESQILGTFNDLCVCDVDENGLSKEIKYDVNIKLCKNNRNMFLQISKGTELLKEIIFKDSVENAKVGRKSMIISTSKTAIMLCFASIKDMETFVSLFESNLPMVPGCYEYYIEDETEYGDGLLSTLKSYIDDDEKATVYRNAMMGNQNDFQNKTILVVGSCCGLLSLFAVEAGADKVYVIEFSRMVKYYQILIDNNKLGDKIKVICGKVEDVVVPELVDVIVSEPMGYMLFNEKMMENYIHARKWLKPSGKMYPTTADLHIAPFSDETLYKDQSSSITFWSESTSFHSVDLTSLDEFAVQENLTRPIAEAFDESKCLAPSVVHSVDFMTAEESDFHSIDISVTYVTEKSDTVHGLAFWFNFAFIGSQSTVWMLTGPNDPLTIWAQVRCLFKSPMLIQEKSKLTGKVSFRCNASQSYNVEISLGVPGTNVCSSNTIDLNYVYCPPGGSYESVSNEETADNSEEYEDVESSIDGDCNETSLNATPRQNISCSDDKAAVKVPVKNLKFLRKINGLLDKVSESEQDDEDTQEENSADVRHSGGGDIGVKSPIRREKQEIKRRSYIPYTL